MIFPDTMDRELHESLDAGSSDVLCLVYKNKLTMGPAPRKQYGLATWLNLSPGLRFLKAYKPVLTYRLLDATSSRGKH